MISNDMYALFVRYSQHFHVLDQFDTRKSITLDLQTLEMALLALTNADIAIVGIVHPEVAHATLV